MDQRSHIVVIYTVAGGGHVAAAKALKEILEATGKHRVTLVNPYVELMPELDLWARLTGRASEDIYNQSIIRDGKTGLYCLTYYAGILLNFRLVYRQGRKILGDYFATQKPDLVISVLPMLNRVIFDALRDYRDQGNAPAAQGAVLITDWTEYGRHIWFPKGRDYFAICGTEQAHQRARGYKNLAGRAFATQGLLLKPSFQGGPPANKAAAKQALGLDPSLPVVTMLYGAQGSGRMAELANALIAMAPRAQVLFLCGHNQALADELGQRKWPFTAQVVGFTDQVPAYLGASDIFVGKPGPGSVSEAVSYGLSLMLDRTMALPQETPVLKWVKRSQAGLSFRGPKDFCQGLSGLLTQMEQGAPPPVARPNLASQQIAQIIEAILHQPATSAP
jgi:1,2-diacylglycerol 3-beta-galactosyltransferase